MAGKKVWPKVALRVGRAVLTASKKACILRKKGSLERGNENIIKMEWMKNRMLSVIKVTYLENMFKTNGQSENSDVSAPRMLEFPRTEPGLTRRINKGAVHKCSEIQDLIEKGLQPKIKKKMISDRQLRIV